MTTQQGLGAARSAVFSPVTFAVALTSPTRPGRVEDSVISRMQFLRTTLGLGATLWLVFAYPLSTGREDFVLGKLEDLLLGCAIVLVAGCVGIAVFILGARSPLGRLYVSRLIWPLRALGAVFLGAGMIWLMLAFLRGDIPVGQWLAGNDITFGFFGKTLGTIISGLVFALILIVGGVACAVGLVAALCFTLFATVTGLNSCFRTADVHELLPALISPLLVWSLAVLQFFDDADVAAPAAVLTAFLLGGPLSVTALSVWEVRRLRNLYGITLRSALGRS
ncbi:hypothetical protein [Streptomyces sp. NRRL S-378]|uniref:hypothetical protein n=1 Tax=Streptomyces sp. NRRL S-378 TaxID=1463904 RepID=UPI00131AB08C|nr:hypothetical protein [Streptomyces sp. NRRL S-378]